MARSPLDVRVGFVGLCTMLRCASSEDHWADWSYHSTILDIEAVMSEYWRAPTGGAVVPGSTVAKANPGRVPPKAPPGQVPPKAPPPGISSLATEVRLAALEEEVAKLRLRVAELEEHSSEAASGSGLARPRARPLD